MKCRLVSAMSLAIAGDVTAQPLRTVKILGTAARAEVHAVQEILPWMNVKPGSLQLVVKHWCIFTGPAGKRGHKEEISIAKLIAPRFLRALFF